MKKLVKHELYFVGIIVLLFLSMIMAGQSLDGEFIDLFLFWFSWLLILKICIFENLVKDENSKVVWIFNSIKVLGIVVFFLISVLMIAYALWLDPSDVPFGPIGVILFFIGIFYSRTATLITKKQIFYNGQKMTIDEIELCSVEKKEIVFAKNSKLIKIAGTKKQVQELEEWYYLNKS